MRLLTQILARVGPGLIGGSLWHAQAAGLEPLELQDIDHGVPALTATGKGL